MLIYNLIHQQIGGQHMEYGYAKVSTREQNDERQRIALTAFGITPRAIFADKQSGRDFDRTQYQRLMRRLKKDDTIVVKSIDRLGRRGAGLLTYAPRQTAKPPNPSDGAPSDIKSAPSVGRGTISIT